ncbi:MAG: bacterial transcriptional activator domain-containing protein [Caldilineaceae bacterium]
MPVAIAPALQEYQRFAQRLRAELDIAPMVETSALYDTLGGSCRSQATHPPKQPPAPVPPICTDKPGVVVVCPTCRRN